MRHLMFEMEVGQKFDELIPYAENVGKSSQSLSV